MFLTKDHIDLSFPDIKNYSQVAIESSRNKNNGALAPSSTYVNQSALYKPPLHNLHSASRNDLKIVNQHLDNNSAMYQFKVNQKLAKKVHLNSNMSSVFQAPDYNPSKILKKFDSQYSQAQNVNNLQRKNVRGDQESQSGKQGTNRSQSQARGDVGKTLGSGNIKLKLPKMAKGKGPNVSSSLA